MDGPTSLKQILRQARGATVGVMLSTAVLNLLLLGVALYLLIVSDTVLPSRSAESLTALLLLIVGIIGFRLLMELLRTHLMQALVATIEGEIARLLPRSRRFVILNGGDAADAQRPLDDLEDITGFLSAPVAVALLDLPWAILSVALLFLLHLWLGVFALVTVLIFAGLCYALDRSIWKWSDWYERLIRHRRMMGHDQTRHIEPTIALGMSGRADARWMELAHPLSFSRQRLTLRQGSYIAIVRALRLAALCGALGVGVALAFADKATLGTSMGAAVLLFLALGPVEDAMAGWSKLALARQARERIDQLLPRLGTVGVSTVLPPPRDTIRVVQLSVRPPGSPRVVVQNVGFQLDAGDALGILGPSGAGKTAMIRGMIGVWPMVGGSVRFDGASIDQWDPDDLARHIGYLPQNAELMAGTVAENIGRFDPTATSEEIIAAARAAGIHELVLRLPSGYETPVGPNGSAIAPGHRQRIALARALFRDPFLVVLDDPTASQDAEGDKALGAAIAQIRARKGIVVLVAYRMNVLEHVQDIMVMRDGAMIAFGPRDETLQRLSGARAAPGAVLKAQGSEGGEPETKQPENTEPGNEEPGNREPTDGG